MITTTTHMFARLRHIHGTHVSHMLPRTCACKSNQYRQNMIFGSTVGRHDKVFGRIVLAPTQEAGRPSWLINRRSALEHHRRLRILRRSCLCK